jgi:predicted transcriptional regulator
MLESIQGTLTIDALMTEQDALVTLDHDEDPSAVQKKIRDLEINQVPVLKDGDVVGLMRGP